MGIFHGTEIDIGVVQLVVDRFRRPEGLAQRGQQGFFRRSENMRCTFFRLGKDEGVVFELRFGGVEGR